MSSTSLIGGAYYSYVTTLLYSTNKCRFVYALVHSWDFFPSCDCLCFKISWDPWGSDDEIELHVHVHVSQERHPVIALMVEHTMYKI